MAVPTIAEALTIDQYLATSYRPDRDYVDGHVEERNLGEFAHARIQGLLIIWFGKHEREWNVVTLPEQRVQVSKTRFRIPDVCLLQRRQPIEQIIKNPPLLCIEILSPEDTVHRTRQRAADYLKMGVEHVWIIDPAGREGLICTTSSWVKSPDGNLAVPGTPIHVPLQEIFADLDAS